ncbi:uncharacterized protein AB675_10374 [Cyphellophora attinorum]|uniref:Uncharacterized protein n=1 Tax=Cyphellophora attinorum TaxID=1664694 RepID=A0A0N1H648_9EURO|nr:uncharacterized protein AB675_10374 [Phialophora attinorum]KPI37476.1 hypothetical protein AB675_10374 [Phialophora attinorum]
MAGGIIFTVLLQRKIPTGKTSKSMTLRFEILKSVLATALWLWLLLDAIFGPRDHYSYYKDRSQRIMVAAISSLLLFILYYPTVWLAYRDTAREAPSSDDSGDERTPLLNDASA